jgi:SecD/SecF fusion protein
MNTSLKLKLGMIIALIIFSVVTIIPSFYSKVPSWWTTYLAPEGLKLGLDLQGGIHLVLRVDLDKAVADSLNLAASDFESVLKDKKIHPVRRNSPNQDEVLYVLPNTQAADTVNQLKESDFSALDITVDGDSGSFPRITLKLKQQQINDIRTKSVDQALEIIRNRIDQLGLAEPVIIRQGANEIVVQLPGYDDPDRAIELIGTTAQLEFKLVSPTSLDLKRLVEEAKSSGKWAEGQDMQRLNIALQGRLPDGTEILFEKDIDPLTKKAITQPILIEKPIMMKGDMVKNARTAFGNFGEPMVELELNSAGARMFGSVTKAHVGRRLAIILDNMVYSAPNINEPILGGRAQITGSFSLEEAKDLALVLRTGALPAPVEVIQNLSVGASLGADSIHKGIMSGLYGTLLVIGFMLIYYRLSGVIANASLAINILLLFASLAMLSATLTLPGIAGIILSIGMAVDANVLVFERMREEFAMGKSVRSGIESGYTNAFWSIVDAQVTTLITALALFLFGTGPIKGFAVTLSLGIIFNLFAVLFCSRLVYESLYSTRSLKQLKFLQFVKRPNFDFMAIRKICFTLSAIMVLAGVVAVVQVSRGQANLGVDFTGGSLLQYKAEQPFALADVRQALADGGYGTADPQEVQGENRLIIKFKVEEDKVGEHGKEMSEILNQAMPDAQFELESASEIGSSVSSTLKIKALQAIGISLLGVLLYLALRFDIGFGIAAAAATFHDVMVVIAACWLLGIEFNLLIVTALLTIAGYSLNDTVVVFDRIREIMGKSEDGEPLYNIVNTSINQVLARSIVTVLTTALTVSCLYLFGGPAIHEFSLALLIGLLVGTYSSIFIASPLLAIKSR